MAFSNPYTGCLKCRVEAFKFGVDECPRFFGEVNERMNKLELDSKETHSVHGGMNEKEGIPVIYITLKK